MLWSIGLVIVGFLFLVLAADRLVIGASALATRLGLSPLLSHPGWVKTLAFQATALACARTL